jgi:hypothetical protein
VAHIYEDHAKRGSKPSLDEIFGALQSVCLKYATVHIIVDALDECTDKDGDRGQLINKLRELQAKIDVRLLSTSRFSPEISQKFQSDLILEVRASEEDVKHFVAGQVLRLPKCIQRDEQLKRDVQHKIVETVDGI